MNHPLDPSVGRLRPVDAHAHVFSGRLRLAQSHRYAPVYDATLDAYLAILDAHDVEHAVLVQPSFLGTDNTYLLGALAREPRRLRGVAVVPPDVEDDELQRLDKQGISGVRLNLLGTSVPDVASPPWTAFWRRLAVLDWHVELHCEVKRLVPVLEKMLRTRLRIVVDHFGRPDPALGVDDPGFRSLLGYSHTRQVWVKVSAAYRCEQYESGFVGEATQQLISHFGSDRVMWGSDWPHTQFESVTDYDAAIATIHEMRLDGDIREAVTRSTAMTFYRFIGDTVREGAGRPTSLTRIASN